MYEYSDEPDDGVHGICYGIHECGECQNEITEVLEEKPELTNQERPVTEVKDGSIVFDHVNFSYKKGSGEYVLKDINLNIHAGETIGIIGGTGVRSPVWLI